MSDQNNSDRCRFFFCGEPHYARGWCAKHYQNLRRYGHAISPNQTDLLSVLQRVRDLCTVVDMIVHTPLLSMDVDDRSGMVRCHLCGRMSVLANVERAQLSELHNDNCPIIVGDKMLAATPVPPADQV